MKKFYFAIKAINDEIHRCVGKVAIEYSDKGYSPMLATRRSKVKHLKEAMKILEEHVNNKNV